MPSTYIPESHIYSSIYIFFQFSLFTGSIDSFSSSVTFLSLRVSGQILASFDFFNQALSLFSKWIARELKQLWIWRNTIWKLYFSLSLLKGVKSLKYSVYFTILNFIFYPDSLWQLKHLQIIKPESKQNNLLHLNLNLLFKNLDQSNKL